MRQRVMIAMALACEPDILIADEPTTALDVTIQAQILELMLDIQKKLGLAIIMVTHDLGVIAEMCDEIIVMYGGRVCERGTADEIFYNPRHEYTKGLLHSIPSVNGTKERLQPIEGTPINMLNMPKGCAFCPRCSEAMKICLEEIPPELTINDMHKAACWINDRVHRLWKRRRTAMGEHLLEVEHLKQYFPIREGFFSTKPLKAVDDVSFTIDPGETLGLVGESGCGKTTVGRSILRLYEPTGGTVKFEGEEITPRNIHSLRKKMQMVFQDPYSSLNPRMTVEDIIGEPLDVHKLYSNRKERRAKRSWN